MSPLRWNRRRWLTAAAGLPLAGCAQPLPVLATIPDFTLTDETARPFGTAQLRGKLWVADFIFTNCAGPCPRMGRQMREVQTAVRAHPNIHLVSFTIDPVRDTPPVLATYARRYQAEPGRWHFLTGPQEQLHQLNRNAFLLGNVDGSLEHSTRFVLVDGEQQVRGYYRTDETDGVARLLSDLRRLRGAWF